MIRRGDWEIVGGSKVKYTVYYKDTSTRQNKDMLIRLCNEKKMYYDTNKSFWPHVNEVCYEEKIK